MKNDTIKDIINDTREHLWRVVTGRRESRRLAAELRKRGIKVAKGGNDLSGSASQRDI